MVVDIGDLTINLDKVEAIDWDHSRFEEGKAVAIYLSNTTLFLNKEEREEFRFSWRLYRETIMLSSSL